MNKSQTKLTEDIHQFPEILEKVLEEAHNFLAEIEDIPPNKAEPVKSPTISIERGIGALQTLEYFKKYYRQHISATSGPRYFGFIVGGSTPASLAGDWLTSVYDQISPVTELTNTLENDTIKLFKTFFDLSDEFDGSFVSGATTSNMVNLATARQWVSLEKGSDSSKSGLTKAIKVLCANPHSSIYKSLAIIGVGRDNLINIDTLKNREAIDINALEDTLKKLNHEPCIVVASAGTVNTADFDDIQKIASLKGKYNLWLHVDAAFGGFAACSPIYRHLVNGWNNADSITIDAHKWLNVPYDSAFQFTKHQSIQSQVFQNNNAPYLEGQSEANYLNLVPENSRRWRALPALFSLISYGADGYREIVERNCLLAKTLAKRIDVSPYFELLADVKLNIICFKLSKKSRLSSKEFLDRLNGTNLVFMTPTNYGGDFAIRIAISNWRTQEKDIELTWKLMIKILNI